jgi:class 3 adenylate cyclase/tetratricopeptide (TPR) repeat protein
MRSFWRHECGLTPTYTADSSIQKRPRGNAGYYDARNGRLDFEAHQRYSHLTTTTQERDRECLSCGRPNPSEARFCGACATPLAELARCQNCGGGNPGGQRFCNACGASLVPAGPPERSAGIPEHLADKIRTGRRAVEGERKQVTVLFADVVGSMDLAERTDPEAWQRLMEGFFTILCAGIHRFEGTVDKFTGDGVMALFGAPIAHEDHAQRACYAALHLQDELAAHAADLRRSEGLNLSTRIGINSGEVVVGAIGEDLDMNYTAVGHTVGLAQRMEALAEPGKTNVSRYTASLVDGYLALDDLGEFNIKGVSHPLHIYELMGPGAARGRLDVSRSRGFSRFVGRDEEIRLLERALEEASSGEATVVGIVGQAGVGKSRLCHEFAERCRARGVPVYHAVAQAHTKSVPLLPVLQLMRGYFGITDHDSDQTARERIAGKLLLLDESFADELPLIYDFLSIPDPERAPPRMDPEARQRRLFELTRRLIRAQSARQPGVNLFEDLHWLDATSEAFLANQVEAIQGTRSITIVNFRPEYSAPWMAKSYYRQIPLGPLGPEETEQMLADVLGSHPSVAGLDKLIRERTGGNPFFIEEVVQSLVEAGNLVGEPGAYELVRLVDDAAVPASVQAVLSARIDRLAERDKAVLQAAAVIGKEFSEEVLGRVAGLDPVELEQTLRNLIASEFVYQQELYPETTYSFKHPLTQEVAYRSQLQERRSAIHAAVAEAIAVHYPDRLDERAALLAEHWESAGETLEAARWHARAAAWTGTHQPATSVEHWRRVREHADLLPESEETAALGLAARTFMLHFGWRLGIERDEAEALFTEAESITSRSGDIRSRAILLPVYGGIRGISDGDIGAFAELARRGLALAEEAQDPDLYLATAPAVYAFYLIGAHEDAVATLDRAIGLADGDPAVGTGDSVACPLAYCLAFKGFTLADLGRLEDGQELIERGAGIARQHDDIETVGWTHMWSVWVAYYSGDLDSMLRHAQQALEIAERIGDSFSRAWSWFLFGLSQKERGSLRGAVEALERSRALSQERRTAVEMDPFRLAVLGECYASLGGAERGVELVKQAVELARQRAHPGGEVFARATLARVLLDSRGGAAVGEVESVIATGLELAQDYGLGAIRPVLHVGLANLAKEMGDEDRRQRELREAHRQFTEIDATGHAERIAHELATAAG